MGSLGYHSGPGCLSHQKSVVPVSVVPDPEHRHDDHKTQRLSITDIRL